MTTFRNPSPAGISQGVRKAKVLALVLGLPLALASLLTLAQCDSDGVTPVCPPTGGDCVTPAGTSSASVIMTTGGATAAGAGGTAGSAAAGGSAGTTSAAGSAGSGGTTADGGLLGLLDAGLDLGLGQ